MKRRGSQDRGKVDRHPPEREGTDRYSRGSNEGFFGMIRY